VYTRHNNILYYSVKLHNVKPCRRLVFNPEMVDIYLYSWVILCNVYLIIPSCTILYYFAAVCECACSSSKSTPSIYYSGEYLRLTPISFRSTCTEIVINKRVRCSIDKLERVKHFFIYYFFVLANITCK